jgi:HEPN domain-containing protein
MIKNVFSSPDPKILLLEEIKNNQHLTSIIAFHSQQAIEKSFKALLVEQDINIPKIHSLNKLFSECKNQINLTNNQIINKLDKVYIDSRYPGDMGLLPYGKPTFKDAKEFYNFTTKVFDKVCNILDIDKEEIIK